MRESFAGQADEIGMFKDQLATRVDALTQAQKEMQQLMQTAQELKELNAQIATQRAMEREAAERLMTEIQVRGIWLQPWSTF